MFHFLVSFFLVPNTRNAGHYASYYITSLSQRRQTNNEQHYHFQCTHGKSWVLFYIESIQVCLKLSLRGWFYFNFAAIFKTKLSRTFYPKNFENKKKPRFCFFFSFLLGFFATLPSTSVRVVNYTMHLWRHSACSRYNLRNLQPRQ